MAKARTPTGDSAPVRTFIDFKRAIYARYQHAPHLELIDQRLNEAIRYVETGGHEGHGFHIFELPPRHGKTVTISRLFPPYVLGRYPDWRFILASYGASLALKNSRYARNIIQSPRYQEFFKRTVQLAHDSKAADAWDIEGHDGGMDAMGVGGGVTGKGAQIIVIDDPVKSREEAESQIYREKVWDWYTDDIFTRREPGGAVILVMTRWHEDDLAGRLLKHEPERWKELSMPAISDAGMALWPERYPLDVLRDIERVLGPYSWSALYQQHPVPAEGGIFKRAWFEREDHPLLDHAPTMVAAVRYWDLAMSEKTSADYTAGVKYGIGEDGHRYILDVVHQRIDWGNLTETMAQVMLADGANVGQYIEQKGYMSRAIQALNVDPRLGGHNIWGVEVDTDKLTRALPAASKAASGVVHVLDRHWTQAFLDELCSFPYAAHDDQVDAFAGAETAIASGLTEPLGGLNYAHSSISSSPY